jgi:hypothetical protein
MATSGMRLPWRCPAQPCQATSVDPSTLVGGACVHTTWTHDVAMCACCPPWLNISSPLFPDVVARQVQEQWAQLPPRRGCNRPRRQCAWQSCAPRAQCIPLPPLPPSSPRVSAMGLLCPREHSSLPPCALLFPIMRRACGSWPPTTRRTCGWRTCPSRGCPPPTTINPEGDHTSPAKPGQPPDEHAHKKA